MLCFLPDSISMTAAFFAGFFAAFFGGGINVDDSFLWQWIRCRKSSALPNRRGSILSETDFCPRPDGGRKRSAHPGRRRIAFRRHLSVLGRRRRRRSHSILWRRRRPTEIGRRWSLAVRDAAGCERSGFGFAPRGGARNRSL